MDLNLKVTGDCFTSLEKVQVTASSFFKLHEQEKRRKLDHKLSRKSSWTHTVKQASWPPLALIRCSKCELSDTTSLVGQFAHDFWTLYSVFKAVPYSGRKAGV
jgi:hypothetical protein